MSDKKYGRLVMPPTQLQRKNFDECCRLLGICVKYQHPLKDKQYSLHGEIETNYSKPKDVWCMFEEHPTQKTQKLLGWNSELQTEASVISVPYDLKELQIGALFEVPSALDKGKGRKFIVSEIYTIMIYPTSVTCKIVPYYETTVDKADTKLFVNTDFNLLRNDEELGY